jgi:hypothetical protein
LGRCSDADAAAIIAQPCVRDALHDRIQCHNATAQGGSTRIARALLVAEPPSIDANEISDKGYINQRAVLSRREALIELLYREPAPPGNPYRQRRYWLIHVRWTARLGLDYARAAADGGDP